MKEIIVNNLSAIFALLGVLLGTLISSMFNLILTQRGTKLIVTRKIVEKEIQAYEDIILITKDLRSVTSIYETDEESNLISYPSCLNDINVFKKFLNTVSTIVNKNSHWIDIKTTRELYFLQDYLVTLSNYIKKIEEYDDSVKYIRQIGLLIKQDFIDLSSSLEKIIFNSYPKNVINLNWKRTNEWHKYKKI